MSIHALHQYGGVFPADHGHGLPFFRLVVPGDNLPFRRSLIDRDSTVGIDSRRGFEIGLELTVKAKRLGLPIAELPTIWLERNTGVSNFKVWAWIPKYMFWYRHAFGRRLTIEELRRGVARSAEDN